MKVWLLDGSDDVDIYMGSPAWEDLSHKAKIYREQWQIQELAKSGDANIVYASLHFFTTFNKKNT